MPATPKTEGKDPDALVFLHPQVPLWLKRKAVQRARDKGMNLSAYLVSLLVADCGERRTK